VGQRVLIEGGPLAGVNGVLAQVKDAWRVVVSVELLQRSVAVEVDRDVVAPAASAWRAPAGRAAEARCCYAGG
jgi:transcription antitermination factor NusG